MLKWYSYFLSFAFLLIFGIVSHRIKRRVPRDSSHHGFNVIITGGSKGIGLNLAHHFLKLGDNVLLASRNKKNLELAVEKLKKKLPSICEQEKSRLHNNLLLLLLKKSHLLNNNDTQILDLEKLFAFAHKIFDGKIDIIINNAGISTPHKHAMNMNNDEIRRVIDVNLIGMFSCCRQAMLYVDSNANQSTDHHLFVFNMWCVQNIHIYVHIYIVEYTYMCVYLCELFFFICCLCYDVMGIEICSGSGSDGHSTPQHAAYGVSKAGHLQLMDSLNDEILSCKSLEGKISVHSLHPGMVATSVFSSFVHEDSDLIMANSRTESADVVCNWLCEKIRGVVSNAETFKNGGVYIEWHNPTNALLRILKGMLGFHKHKFFDSQGKCTVDLD
ncbi:short-chain dehydrogenase [Reticulomyxa filosa]|uniref:Short-chain dehydrogenase n=1 Tax=Reticulomyxa filosa TaxID=46433 RepID=X6P3Y5_RETFI|nr:short-chain dehydrogenase [Reticulomyxa filosa]|eukprot:ETO32297.1 short-chain dehydrogenase [Reticulomyxa filosa]